MSKHHSIERIQAVFDEGQRNFGENYAQELAEKAEKLAHLPIIWSFIGHIQSNKIKTIVRYASEIQTLASLKHAKIIDQELSLLGKSQFPVYLAVNADNEPGKNGVSLEDLPKLSEDIASFCPNLRVMGLMAIPPAKFSDDEKASIPPLYRRLKDLALTIGEAQLSLGMSGDLRIAIEAGSNLIRIGTAIFGPRETTR